MRLILLAVATAFSLSAAPAGATDGPSNDEMQKFMDVMALKIHQMEQQCESGDADFFACAMLKEHRAQLEQQCWDGNSSSCEMLEKAEARQAKEKAAPSSQRITSPSSRRRWRITAICRTPMPSTPAGRATPRLPRARGERLGL